MAHRSDSGYGSVTFGKMNGQGQFDLFDTGTQLSNTNEQVFLSPSWHNQLYRDEYAQSVLSGNDTLPDQNLLSPDLDYSLDQSMHQPHDGNEQALASIGAFDDLNVSDSSAIVLNSGFLDVAQGSDVHPFIHNMKRSSNQFDAQTTPQKKRTRTVSHRSGFDGSTQDISSSLFSHELSRNQSSAGQSYYQPQPLPDYNNNAPQLHDQDMQWPNDHQLLPQNDDGLEDEQSPSQERPKAKPKKKHFCIDCPGKAFTTANDLERHNKTVHGKIKPGEKVWMCSIGNCAAGTKVWARQDNFKQHVTRMHNEKHHDAVETMAVNYDPDKHDIQTGKKKLKAQPMSSDSSTELERHGYTPGTSFNASGPILQRMSHSVTGSGNTSLHNHAFSSGDSSTLHMMDNPRGSKNFPRAGGPHPTLKRSIPATVANAETIAERQRELRDHNNQPTPLFKSGLQDLSEMGVGMANDFPEHSLFDNIQARRHSHTVNLNLVAIPEGENEFLKRYKDLPLESQDRIRTLLNTFQTPVGNSQQDASLSQKARNAQRLNESRVNSKHHCAIFSCGKSFAKTSELKKHERRHDRRYGCTFDRCFKKFGTKWEWKRHERTQHLQNKEFRCDSCGQCFDTERTFMDHLKAQHRMSREEQTEKLTSCVLGLKWIGSFWCGFCEDIIRKPETRGNDVLDERYNHISDHIDRKENPYSMSQWVELRSGGQTKAQSKKALEDAKQSSSSPDNTSPGHSEQTEESPGLSASSDEDESVHNTTDLNTRQPPQPGNESNAPHMNTQSSLNADNVAFALTTTEQYASQSNFPPTYSMNEMRPRSHSDVGYNRFMTQAFSRMCGCGASAPESGLEDNAGSFCPNCGASGLIEDYLNPDFSLQ